MTDETEKEQARWQEAINTLCCKLAPEANIDGAGCDSGDSLDLSLSEIEQAHNHWQNRAYDALDALGLHQAVGEKETSLDALIRLFPSDDWEPDVQALRANNVMLVAELNVHRKQAERLKYEIACMKLERDALLEMTWLDLPAEPHESTATWRKEFERGWMRREEQQNKSLRGRSGIGTVLGDNEPFGSVV